MKVIVTGATGFIGHRLVWRLLEDGHDVAILSRKPAGVELSIGFPCAAHAWDPEKEQAPASALEGADAVVHLAGEPVAGGRWTPERKRRIESSRSLGTVHLVEAIEKMGRKPEVLVSASAVGYYGDRGDEALDESASPGSDFLAQVCEKWEAPTRALSGVRVVNPRIGVVLDSEGGALEKLLPPFELGVGGKVGSGRQWMSWIHIDDLISGLLECLRNPSLSGPVNLVAPEPVTNREFAGALARRLGKPAIFAVPALALKAALGEMSHVVLTGQRVFPRKLEAAGFHFRFNDLDSALANLLPDSRRGGVQRITTTHWIDRPIEEVFRFFTDEKNLEAITPPLLSFHVLGKSTPTIEKGTLIDYQLKVRGVPMRWRTLIETWEPNRRFRDIQLKGPYSKWEHEHRFEPFRGGTLMKDEVLYQVPGGPLRIAVLPLVKKDVSEIFRFRGQKISEAFK